ncbi:MAG: MBL fold metallo-hydrolase [Acidobacteriota bacterium]
MRRYTDHDPDYRPKDLATVLRWAVWDRLTGRRRIAPPGPGAPWVEIDVERLSREPDGGRVTWLGHASFLVQLGLANVLIDPVLGHRVGPYRRHSPPGIAPTALPPVHALLVTHSHYDHLDAWTVRRLDRSTPVRVPLGLGGFFRRRGFRDVDELDWWQHADLDSPGGRLRVTLVPARHWSSRYGSIDLNTSLWGGFVIEGVGRSVYHAGDTGDFDQFARIGELVPDGFDLALLPIGAYEPAWFMEAQHMNPEQAGRAFLTVGARHMIPMHWGAFQLTDEALAEPPERLRRFWHAEDPGDGRAIWFPAVGEARDF